MAMRGNLCARRSRSGPSRRGRRGRAPPRPRYARRPPDSLRKWSVPCRWDWRSQKAGIRADRYGATKLGGGVGGKQHSMHAIRHIEIRPWHRRSGPDRGDEVGEKVDIHVRPDDRGVANGARAHARPARALEPRDAARVELVVDHAALAADGADPERVRLDRIEARGDLADATAGVAEQADL